MDTLTHIALGACMGEAFAGKKLGKKAMVWGVLAQSAPDIDFLASFWLNTPSNLLAHRGFTHSFVFSIAMTTLFAFLAERFHRPHDISFRKWTAFFGIAILGHLFIDAFNNYGVGWLEPFSHHRFSFQAIYVADPFFSIGPAIACVALLLLRRNSPRRKKAWLFGLLTSGVYLLYALCNKAYINSDVKQALQRQQISYTRYFTTPAPLQNWLWFVVAGTDSGYHVGYRSVFDKGKEISFQYFPRHSQLLDSVHDREEVQQLIRFSQGFYTVEKYGDTLVFNDLRFGQEVGWYDARARFAFHYYLDHPKDNTLVVQRGRFARWNNATFHALLNRISGH